MTFGEGPYPRTKDTDRSTVDKLNVLNAREVTAWQFGPLAQLAQIRALCDDPLTFADDGVCEAILVDSVRAILDSTSSAHIDTEELKGSVNNWGTHGRGE